MEAFVPATAAGDPGQIAANAQTWRNIAADLQGQGEGIDRAVRFDLSEWTGTASDAPAVNAGAGAIASVSCIRVMPERV